MFGFEITYPLLWIALAVTFAIIEAFTLGLTTIWFAAGSLIAMIGALVGISPTWQILVFLVSSSILIYFTRPFAVNLLKIGKQKTNAQSLLGETGMVIEEIRPFQTGLVKVSGQIWTAKSKDDTIIEKNKKVKISHIEGVKLMVEELKEA